MRPKSPQFMVKRQKCFENLTDDQIVILRYVKIVDGTKLYRDLIVQSFNKIPPEQCNKDDILADLVSKVTY